MTALVPHGKRGVTTVWYTACAPRTHFLNALPYTAECAYSESRINPIFSPHPLSRTALPVTELSFYRRPGLISG